MAGLLLGLTMGAKNTALARPDFQATVQQGWTVTQARAEAFAEVEPVLDASVFAATDPDYRQNRRAIDRRRHRSGDRLITLFNDGRYAVRRVDHRHTFYYSPRGVLELIEYELDNAYPQRAARYRYPGGRLDSVVLTTQPLHSFVFGADGQLLGRWSWADCRDPARQSCGQRKTVVVKE